MSVPRTHQSPISSFPSLPAIPASLLYNTQCYNFRQCSSVVCERCCGELSKEKCRSAAFCSSNL